MDDGIGKLSSSRVYVNLVITRKMGCGETLCREFAPAWNSISGSGSRPDRPLQRPAGDRAKTHWLVRLVCSVDM
jgi:hypothetical protein